MLSADFVLNIFHYGMGILFFQKKLNGYAVYNAFHSTEGCVMTVMIFKCSTQSIYFHLKITLELTTFVFIISHNVDFICMKIKLIDENIEKKLRFSQLM